MADRVAIEILQRARVELQSVDVSGTLYGVCWAVTTGTRRLLVNTERSEEQRAQLHGVCDRILSRISYLLGPELAWLTGWLVEHGHATREELFTAEGMQKLRQTRLNWIDDLIRYYEGAK